MHGRKTKFELLPLSFFFLKLSTEVCQAFLKGCDNLLDRTLQGGLKTLEDCENKAQYLTSASSVKVNTANCLYRNILIKSCFLPFSFIRLVNTITWFCFPWSPTFQSRVCACCIAASFHFGKCVPLLMVVVTDQFLCRTWLRLLSMLNRLWPVPRPYFKLVRRYRLVDTFLCNSFFYSAYCSSLCAFTSFSFRKKCFTVHSKVAYM